MAKLTDIQKAKVEDCYNDLMQLSTRIEQLLIKISTNYNQTMVANNESFINAVHTLEEALNELEKISEPIKKLL